MDDSPADEARPQEPGPADDLFVPADAAPHPGYATYARAAPPQPSAAPPPTGEPTPSAPARTSAPHAASRHKVQLKPGTVGAPYQGTLAVPDRPAAVSYEAVGLAALGLTLNPQTGALAGEPTQAGEHRFEAVVTILDARGQPARVELACEWLVNPNPRSMWKTLEPPAEAPHRKPHEASVRHAADDLLIVGASKRGRSHAHEGKFREDALGAMVLDGGWRVAVVCDGAGSASLSRLGSEVVVQACLERLRTTLVEVDEPAFQDAVARLATDRADPAANRALASMLYATLVEAGHEAAKATERAAALAGATARDLASTLVLVLVRTTPAGVFVGGFSVGDGGAGLLRLSAEHVKPLTHPDSGEFAGQTRFLSLSDFDAEVSDRLRMDIQPDFDAILLMSDGVTDPRLPTEAALADPAQWRALWSELTAAIDFRRDNPDVERQLLDWLDFWSPGNHDDRTLVVIVP